MLRRLDHATARWVATAIVGALAIAIAARVTLPLPGTDLPQSGQTLAVLLVGSALGPCRGAASVGLYLFAGALGLPVFADGASGIDVLLGPSCGYLVGFPCAAAGVGWFAARKRLAQPWWCTLLIMLGAHALILLLGGVGIALRFGPTAAWSNGVAPFLLGGVAKSVIAAAVVVVVEQVGSAQSHAK